MRKYNDPPGEKMYQPHVSGRKRLKCKQGLERTYGPSLGSQVLACISDFVETKAVSVRCDQAGEGSVRYTS